MHKVKVQATNFYLWKVIMELPDRIKIVRDTLELSQKDMAKAIGVSLTALQGYEAGRSVPGGDVIKAFVKLGFNANWLLTGEGEMTRGDKPAVNGAMPDWEPSTDHPASMSTFRGSLHGPDDDTTALIANIMDQKAAQYGELTGIKGFAMATIIYKIYGIRFIESPEYRMDSLETIIDCLFKLASGKCSWHVTKPGDK